MDCPNGVHNRELAVHCVNIAMCVCLYNYCLCVCLLYSVVATPGRFLHLVMEMDLKLSSVEYIVFDEADRLFEMGFSEQLREIIKRLPEMR